MAALTPEERPAWYTSPRFRAGAIFVLVAFALGEGVVAIFLRNNDFAVHRAFGEGFLAGDPYGEHQVPYFTTRAMLNALTAWLPYRVDRAIVYGLALAALAWTLFTWQRLASASRPLSRPVALAAVVFALAVTGTYLQRDLDDCGLQILLLFFLTAAVAHLQAGQSVRCGFWLALAAVYKTTPLLFLPYLCYKRQWRAAGWTVVFLVALGLAPALRLGWNANLRAYERWWEFTCACLANADPSENALDPPNHRNQALTLALARFAQTYPPGHSLYLQHPLFVQFGNLEPAQAKRVVQGFLLVLAGVLAWRFRKSFGRPGQEADMACEWAAVMLLTALLSPLCWLQHMVLVVPAVFLAMRAALEPGGLTAWQRRLGWVAALVMMFAGQRDLWGHSFFMILMSYKVHSWAALVALALVLTLSEPERRRQLHRLPVSPPLAA